MSTLRPTLSSLVAYRVAAAPDSVAVVTDDGSLSYGSLDDHATDLATWLSSMDIGAGDVVAVVLQRSMDLVVALCGVAKAGAAYVCVDPTTPARRLARTIEHTGARALVAGGLTDRLPAELPVYPGPLVRPAADRRRLPSPPRRRPATTSDLAVVIYTSGTTGEPRAVALEHRQVVPVVTASEVDIRPGDRILLLASVAFDASAFEVWATLAHGATLVVARDPAELTDLLGRHRITGMLISSALFATFVDVGRPRAGSSSLRWVYVGGEELSPRHAARFIEAVPGCALHNCYGPTETTVFATWQRVGPCGDGPVPIGSPALGKRVYLFDEELGPASSGEIYIGGAGVARGYHGAPAATAERFVPDPAGGPGQRMYRTGDLASRKPNGTLDFRGRIDRQAKVRGHRVDPGEVEAVLRRSPGVAQGLINAVARRTGGTALCAYVVLAPGPDASVAAVREWLAERLPHYLVPSRFVTLEALPLTQNGKVDRTALPAPWRARAITDTAYVPPRTDLERALCELWSDVLGSAEVGLEDNFFELGGDSLSSVELLARVGGLVGVELTVRDLIENQTAGELAAAVERRIGGGHGQPAVPVGDGQLVERQG